MGSYSCGVVESEDVEVAKDHTKAIEQFDWCCGYYTLAIDEHSRLWHRFDGHHTFCVHKDAVFMQNVGARQLDLRLVVLKTAGCSGSRLYLVDQALWNP